MDELLEQMETTATFDINEQVPEIDTQAVLNEMLGLDEE